MKKVIVFIKKVYSNLFFRQQRKPVRVCTEPKVKPGKLSVGSNGSILQEMACFLKSRYDFRFNLLSEVTEYRPKTKQAIPFRLVGQRELNTLCLAARKEGIECWDRDVSRFVNSEETSSYHPFLQYMNRLPEWDGTDRLNPLALRVSDEAVWVKGFSRWMLGVTAQWLNMDPLHANSVAPVLISKKQGMHKSTFCKMLMPSVLQSYYTDCFDLNAASASEQKLTAFGLINLDEMDKFTSNKMALLKNLMQVAGLNIRKMYKKSYSALPRVASFIATSNQKEILTDPTGSRRFLCVEVKKKIDCSPIDHDQLYAQLKQMLAEGAPYWFTTEEEAEIMTHNAPFQRHGLVEDLFCRYYRASSTTEEATPLLAIDIYEHLKKLHPGVMSKISPNTFAKTLVSLNIERIRKSHGTYYQVVCRA